MSSFMHRHGFVRHAEYKAVFRAWDQVVPLPIRERARPVSFRGGRLIVQVDSAPLLNELTHFRASEFLLLLNKFLGAQVHQPMTLVEKVEFRAV